MREKCYKCAHTFMGRLIIIVKLKDPFICKFYEMKTEENGVSQWYYLHNINFILTQYFRRKLELLFHIRPLINLAFSVNLFMILMTQTGG